MLAVIKSYYGNYWLEMEEAITKRDSATAPARFEQSKVPLKDRAMIAHSIGKMLHLCSKTTSFTKLRRVHCSELAQMKVGTAQNML